MRNYNHFHSIVCQQHMYPYIRNLTSSYTDKINEPTRVSASLIMFILAGLFFNLNLFSGISDVSAILDPKFRMCLSTSLSIFLPVMSYLFSEAKNAGSPSSSASSSSTDDLSLRAGLILTWMLLVELLRKKVDEIRMQGYSSIIQRAGRVVWLGSLVFFNIQSAGRKAVFSILRILCATKVVQRVAFTEVGKRSYAHGKTNGWLLTSYMAQLQEQEHQEHHLVGDHGVEQAFLGGNELLKRCKYIVMGEEMLVQKITADGYKLKKITPNDSIITVGKVWEVAERNQLFASSDQNQRLKRLCLSFSLFKLLRRRFEHLPAMTDDEAIYCRDLIWKGLYNTGERKAEALFQVISDEVNFLSEYYHSVVPVVLASPFFLLVNYFLLHIIVLGLCLMTVVLCGNGDLTYAFRSIPTDNYTLRPGIARIAICLLTKATQSPSAFFSIVDLSITFLLFIIFFYEEIWEFLVFLLSNWFIVSLLCSYVAEARLRESPTFKRVFRSILWLRSIMSNTTHNLKQFSVLNLRCPLISWLPTTPFLTVQTATVPDNLKEYILEFLVEHNRGTTGFTPLTNGRSALRRNNLFDQLSWACKSNSVAQTILTWHVATSLLDVKCLPQCEEEEALSNVAKKLSKYCAYLVAFHPEVLPDNQEITEAVFMDMSRELKVKLGCLEYYFSRRHTRVEKITETTGYRENKVVRNGATLGMLLMEESNNSPETVWKVLADVWTELIIYIAASSDEERVKGHENVLEQGAEFITVLWALAMHTGISQPADELATMGGHPKA